MARKDKKREGELEAYDFGPIDEPVNAEHKTPFGDILTYGDEPKPVKARGKKAKEETAK